MTASDTSCGGRPSGVTRWLGAGALAAALVGLMWGPALLDLAGGGRTCSYLLRTGRPCAACGGTHALALAARGRLLSAWRRNPLGAYTGLSLWALGVAGAAVLLVGRRSPLSFVGAGILVTGPAVLVWTIAVWLSRLP